MTYVADYRHHLRTIGMFKSESGLCTVNKSINISAHLEILQLSKSLGTRASFWVWQTYEGLFPNADHLSCLCLLVMASSMIHPAQLAHRSTPAYSSRTKI